MVRSFFGDQVFQTVIPRNVRLSEAPSFGLPVALYAPKSTGAEAYAAAAEGSSGVGRRGLGAGCPPDLNRRKCRGLRFEEVPVSAIQPNTHQPRSFGEAGIKNLRFYTGGWDPATRYPDDRERVRTHRR